MEMGTMIWTARGVKESENDLWRIESFMTIPTAKMEQYTRVDAEKENFLPVFGQTKSQTGNFKADYEKGKVKLTTIMNNKASSRSIMVDGVVYDNEQALYLIRRMPLKKGYSEAFTIFPVQGGTPVECRVYVVSQEKVTVPAGMYDSYKLDLAIYAGDVKALQHTLWFSADEHKYLVKYDSRQAIMELTEVSQLQEDQPVKFSEKEPAISLEAPAGWFFYKAPAVGKYNFMLRLLPPEMKAWALLTIAERSDAKQTVQQVADGDIEVLKGYFKNYTVRKDSMKNMTVSGLPAIKYIADYEDKGQSKVEYRTYILGKSMIYWFVFRIEKDQFENNQKDFDSIVKSFKTK
jgi:hypothetical protein